MIFIVNLFATCSGGSPATEPIDDRYLLQLWFKKYRDPGMWKSSFSSPEPTESVEPTLNAIPSAF